MDTKIFNKLNQLKNKIDFHDNKYIMRIILKFQILNMINFVKNMILINENPEFKFLERKTVGHKPQSIQKYNHRKPMTSLTKHFLSKT